MKVLRPSSTRGQPTPPPKARPLPQPNLSLEALLNHSSSALRELNINGWSSTSEGALQNLGKKAEELEKVDIDWCRNMDNWVVKGVVEGCEGLKEMKVWGCNRLTVDCPKKVRFSK